MTKKMLIIPGDGVGPEIYAAMAPLFDWLRGSRGLEFEIEYAQAGYAAYAAEGVTINDRTLIRALASDAVLFGSESTEEFAHLPRAERPPSGLLRLRQHLGGFANIRPIKALPELVGFSSLKESVLHGVDFVVVRELLGGIYFGRPSGIETPDVNGRQRAIDTMVYYNDEIERVARIAFEIAQTRRGKLCSVDKANVLATSAMWREVVSGLAKDYPDVELTHMYVDNAAMQLVRNPRQFDVIVTENLFGDILSDCAAMITGSIGMLPSASVGEQTGRGTRRGLYEPIHGTAPDIAGKGIVNPIGTILSLAMALRYSLEAEALARTLEGAVTSAIRNGARPVDLGGTNGTTEIVSKIIDELGRA